MKRRTMLLGLALPALLSLAMVAHAGNGAMMIGMEGGFDLSELADGETRIFEAGKKSVTVQRSGDLVTIRKGDGTTLPSCNLSTDRCTIRTDDEHIYMAVSREQVCEGEDCAEMDVDVAAMPDGTHVMIRKSVRCDGEDCTEEIVHGGGEHNVFIKKMADCHGDDCGEWITADGDHIALGEAHANVFVVRPDGAQACEGEDCPEIQIIRHSGSPSVSWVGEGDGAVVLFDRENLMWKGADDMDGCPEGYRQMRYTDETAEDGYLCVGERGGSHGATIERILHRKPKRD